MCCPTDTHCPSHCTLPHSSSSLRAIQPSSVKLAPGCFASDASVLTPCFSTCLLGYAQPRQQRELKDFGHDKRPREGRTLPGALAGTAKDRARCIRASLKLVDYMHVPLSAGSFKYKVSVARFYFALVAYLTCSVCSLEKEVFIKNLKVPFESKNLF